MVKITLKNNKMKLKNVVITITFPILIVFLIFLTYHYKPSLIGKWSRISLYSEYGVVELSDTMILKFINDQQYVKIYNGKSDTLNYALKDKLLNNDSSVLYFVGRGIELNTTISIVENDTLVMMSLSPNYEPYVMQVFTRMRE